MIGMFSFRVDLVKRLLNLIKRTRICTYIHSCIENNLRHPHWSMTHWSPDNVGAATIVQCFHNDRFISHPHNYIFMLPRWHMDFWGSLFQEKEIFIAIRYYKSEHRWYSLNTVNFCPGDILIWGARGKHQGVAAHEVERQPSKKLTCSLSLIWTLGPWQCRCQLLHKMGDRIPKHLIFMFYMKHHFWHCFHGMIIHSTHKTFRISLWILGSMPPSGRRT